MDELKVTADKCVLPEGTKELSLEKSTMLKFLSKFYSQKVTDLVVEEDQETEQQYVRLVFELPELERKPLLG